MTAITYARGAMLLLAVSMAVGLDRPVRQSDDLDAVLARVEEAIDACGAVNPEDEESVR